MTALVLVIEDHKLRDHKILGNHNAVDLHHIFFGWRSGDRALALLEAIPNLRTWSICQAEHLLRMDSET